MAEMQIPAYMQLTRRDPVTGKLLPIPAAERINRIIEHPRTKEVVRSMDPQSLYSLIADAGINDSYDLVLLSSPQQIQSFLDYDCWRRDEFDLDQFTDWMETLLQANDLLFVQLLQQLDSEAIAIWLRENVALFEWEGDRDVLDTIDDPVSSTPDGVYALVFPGDPVAGERIRLLLERIYAFDVEYAINLLQGVRWELTSDMNEHMYRKRTARLADQGFAPLEEAIEVYAWMDPIPWLDKARQKLDRIEVKAPPVGTIMPHDGQLVALQTRLASGRENTFAATISALQNIVPQDELKQAADSVLAQFRAVTNRAHVADLGNPGDQNAAREAADRVQSYVGIALEMLTPDDPELRARALLTFPLKELHRVGFSATRNLSQQALQLAKRGNLSVVEDDPFSLLQDEDAEFMKGLLRPRPTLHAGRGTAFKSFDDVRRGAERLGGIAFAELLFFAWLRIDRSALVEVIYNAELNQTPAESVTLRTLFATLLANGFVDASRALTPLKTSEFESFVAHVRGLDDPFTDLLAAARERISAVQPEGQELPFADRFAAETATWIVENIEALGAPIDPNVARELVLLAPPRS